ncbi:hypothetical protein DACRYDRAFT_78548 [Dacryopinax primogenitus]|uniref:Xylanolytic transcriptional activator regulatory domain-containing protein n=1 Tax=Dacryopinax primogenitus (strain DJM 731) TaxID=1858805 RepID=M5G380_DACPD|nr:uncharacterized protein DACRYDRAFT_78548 [Dacryopinax primogenitus]EJU02675.1 hypothetical protein DACRYDRAFT_78548 [Dacryopinax primogenitus]
MNVACTFDYIPRRKVGEGHCVSAECGSSSERGSVVAGNVEVGRDGKDKIKKKRGPPYLYLRRLTERQQAAAAAATAQSTHPPSSPSTAAAQAAATLTSLSSLSPLAPPPQLDTPMADSPSVLFEGMSPNTALAQIGMSSLAWATSPTADASNLPVFALPYAPSPSVTDSYTSSLAMQPPVQARGVPQPPQTQVQGGPLFPSTRPHPSQPPSQPPDSKRDRTPAPDPSRAALLYPPLDYHYNRQHRISDIYPRHKVILILQLFFDFCYPLTPFLHKPSFWADLESRREERDSLFFALVMSTVARTVTQVPRSYLPMSRLEVRRLAQACYEASRHITVDAPIRSPSMLVAIRFFDARYLDCCGNKRRSDCAYNEAVHIALKARMHDERTYDACDPIEREVRSRLIWLLYGAMQSSLDAEEMPGRLTSQEFTAHLPIEVDDEYITLSGVGIQPPGTTSIISGLVYTTRIFIVLDYLLSILNADRRVPPTGAFAQARLEEVEALHDQVMSVLDDVPPHLRLRKPGEGPDVRVRNGDLGELLGLSQSEQTRSDLMDFLTNRGSGSAEARNPFLVLQANMYVTQQLVRSLIERFRHELRLELASDDAVRQQQLKAQHADEQDAIAKDLLQVLHSIPIQAVAANGPTLVAKIRRVASVFLDRVQQTSGGPPGSQTALTYLWEFLTVLSEIEQNYLLEDDPLEQIVAGEYAIGP